jgi:dienelactone hydrolase
LGVFTEAAAAPIRVYRGDRRFKNMKIKRIRHGAGPRRLLVLFGGWLALAGSAGWAADLQVTVSPPVAVYGRPFSLKITGLRPGEQATVKAVSKDARNILWESAAVFEADASGSVDLARQAPVSGSYGEADIFGLLWSMKPANPPSQKRVGFTDDPVNGWAVDFSVTDTANKTAAARFRCVYQMPGEGLVRLPLEKDGLCGFLYHPAEGGPFPGVIILGGSNGGLYEYLAQAFASNGFAALTLAYFQYPNSNLPVELVEIPLEYFIRAAAWMKGQPKVAAGRLGLVGGSKGGELALLLASRIDEFRAVVAWTPSAYVWEGLSRKFYEPGYGPRSSWSFDGQPLPFMPFKASPEDMAKGMKGELSSYVPFHRDSLLQSDPETIEKAAIPVEKIRAPILLVSGTDDQTWPAGEFCAAIVARLKKAGFAFEVKHVVHEKGGHQSFLPYVVTANRGGISGGTPQADARGGYRSWAETMAFLHRHLAR